MNDWLDIETRKPGALTSVQSRKRMAARATRIRNKIRKWEQQVLYAKPMFKQCQTLIRKFGGIVPFAVAVGAHPDDIIRYWLGGASVSMRDKDGKRNTSRRSRGRATNGFIPSALLPRVIVAARYYGLLLTPEDLYPEFLSNEPMHLKDLEIWSRSIKKDERAKEFEHVLASLASTRDFQEESS